MNIIMERTKLWETIYNKSNKKVTFLSTNERLKEARVRNPSRNDQMNPSIIVQEASIFLEDEGFSKLKYGTEPRPKTFTIFDKQGEISVNVAINGDYIDDILINAFFDPRCGFGYVIQSQTLDGRIEWVGFDKSEFREDLEDALVSAKKFFEENKDKHTLEMWLIREFGQDKAHDTLEKLYQRGQEETFTKFLSREDFDAYKSSLTEKTESAMKENKSLKEGWKNAKACDEEDYGADYEDEYWEDYDPIQESAKLKEDADNERKEMQALFRKAARKAKVKILDTYTKNKRHWSVTLDTEDEYDADNFRDAMDELLGENSGTHSYDDMEGLGNVHIGVFEYYEYSDDDYRDLDPSIRDKYVVYCEPAELYKRRRQMDW